MSLLFYFFTLIIDSIKLVFISESSDSETDISISGKDESKMSGISPFLSAEDIRVSKSSVNVESMSSYYTCYSSMSGGNKTNTFSQYLTANADSKRNDDNASNTEHKENFKNILNVKLTIVEKVSEDSGISSRKSDASSSNNRSDDLHSKEEFSHDFSRSINNSNATNREKMENQSPIRSGRGFKHPEFTGYKRKRFRGDSLISDNDASTGSTGLTQEIDCMDIGSSTPKKRKAKRSPLKSVLKPR